MNTRDERDGATFTEFWAHYLLHHQRPFTRTLHFLGSSICLGGAALAVIWASVVPLIVALGLGYLCAFGGHWWVERNKPLTFEHPIRAGLANWRLFGVECMAMIGVGGGFEQALKEAVARAPHVVAWSCDAGNQ